MPITTTEATVAIGQTLLRYDMRHSGEQTPTRESVLCRVHDAGRLVGASIKERTAATKEICRRYLIEPTNQQKEAAISAGYRIRENRHTARNNGFYFLQPDQSRDDAPITYATEAQAWAAAVAHMEDQS